MLTAISLTAASLQAWNFWTLRHGAIPHARLAVTYALYGVVEVWLAVRDPAQAAIFAFVVLDAWCVGMALAGMRKTR